MNGNAAAMKRSARNRTHTGGRVTRPKPMERSYQFDGIYYNARFLHAAASMVGCNVQVQTVEGSVYEGIFRTFSPQFECVVEMAHKVDKTLQKINHISAPSKDAIIGKLIIGPSDFVMLTMANADLDYATKDRFATDNAISKFNGQAGERDLEPWDETTGDGIEMPSLEIDNANGWDVNDMFRTNEQQYGVQSTYDSALSGYTMQLEKKNTDEYKKQEAKALKIASEIESSASYRARIALENTDEDEKISSVVRPADSSNCVGKYVPPAKRKIQQGGKLTRSSVSPQNSYAPSGGKSMQGVAHSGPSQPLHAMQSNSGGVGAPSSHVNLVSRYSHTSQHHAISSSASAANGTPMAPASKPLLNQAPQIQSPDGEAKINGDKLEKEDRKHSAIVVDSKLKVGVDEARDGDLKMCGDGPMPTSAAMQQLPMANHVPPKYSRKIVNAKDEVTADLKKFKSNFKLSEDRKEDSSKLVEQAEIKDKIDSDLDKMSNTLKKSTLNPNAKEFVFNPNAKSFTPRSPSTPQTPTPPRPHTPGAGVMCAPPPSLPIVQPHIYTTMPTQYMMSAPISAVSLSAASPMSQAAAVAAMQQQQQQQQQGPRFRKSTPTSVQHRPDFTPSMHVAAATGQPILASAAMAAPPSFIQYTPQGLVQAPGAPQHGMPYTQMYSVVAPRLMTPQGMTMVSTSHLVTHPDTQHVPSQIFVSPHPGVHQALPPGATPPHQATTPIPTMTATGQHPNAGSQQGPMGQVTGIHPTPSPVHGNTPNPQNPQPNSAQQLPYQATHGPLGQPSVQPGPHNTPNSPQSMHPGATPSSMAPGNHHFHPGPPIVAHSGGGGHTGQGHPHPSQASYPGGPQPSVVLIHQQAPGTPTPSHPQGVPTHTLQGHTLHGHAASAQVAHLVPHTSMAMPIIPATSSGAVPTQHQIYIQHPSAHTHGPPQPVQTYPHAQ